MSKEYAKLCSMIIGETFGPGIQSVGDALVLKAPQSLRLILNQLKLPLSAVQAGLSTLIQHSIVRFETNSESGDIIYFIDFQMAIEIMRFPRYLNHTEISTGPVSREILEELLQTGQISISKLIYICGYRVLKANPTVSESVMKDQLSLFYNTLLKLSGRRFIIIVPPIGTNCSWESSGDIQGESSSPFRLPEVDLKKILRKLCNNGKIDLEKFPDANILWRINIPQYHAELRNELVYAALDKKFASMVDSRIFSIMMESGFEKHPWENDGSPVSFAEMKDKIERLQGGAITSKYMHEHLEIIEDDPLRIVARLGNTQGGHFSFNMKTAVCELLWNTVDRIITEKHGFHALRIFRLVKEKEFMEQDEINEKGMIPGKEAKHLTYQLVEDNFVNIKEVRKSYAAGAQQMGKISHLFYVDNNQVVRAMRDYCYKSILNLKLKSKIEKEKIKRLSIKEEKITRILMNMANKECTEDQMEEIRELLTPPERQLLHRYQIQSAKLLAGAMQADETLFITELYMKYNYRKLPAKEEKRRHQLKKDIK